MTCLSLVFGLNYSFWEDLKIDRALFNMFLDLLSGYFIGVENYVLMRIVA